jgi:hypothetical protein
MPTIIKDETQQPTLDAQHLAAMAGPGAALSHGGQVRVGAALSLSAGGSYYWQWEPRRVAAPTPSRSAHPASGVRLFPSRDPRAGGPFESGPPPAWAGRPVVEVEWASPIWSDPESESRYALTTVQNNAHCD